MDNIIEWPEESSIEEQAAQWVILLDSGEEFSEANKAALREWLSLSPEHAETLKKLNTFWADNSLTELLEPALASAAVKSDSAREASSYWHGAWQPVSAVSAVLVLGLVFLFGVDGHS